MTGRLSVRAVVEAVSGVTGFAPADIVGPRRQRELVRARQIAMYFTKTYCRHLSFPEIGRRMGARDHTTILHGVRKIEAEIEQSGKDSVMKAVELVLLPAQQAVELLHIDEIDPDPMTIAERAMTEHGVARVTFEEIRAMASFVMAAVVGGRLIIDPPEPEPMPIDDALVFAVRTALIASRDFQVARFGRGEASALDDLQAALKGLHAAYAGLGYSLASSPVFKTTSNAPRKEAANG